MGDVKDKAGKLASKLTDVMTTMKSLEDATLVSEQQVAQLTKEKRELQALNTNTAEELRKVMEEVSTHAINLNEAHKTTKSLEDALSVSEQHVAQLNEEKRDFEIIKTKTEEELQKAKEEVYVLLADREEKKGSRIVLLANWNKDVVLLLCWSMIRKQSVLLCITWLHLPEFKQLKTNVVLKDADAWLSELTMSSFQNEVLMKEVTRDGYASVKARVVAIVIVRIEFVVVLVEVVVDKVVGDSAYGIDYRNRETENGMRYWKTVSQGLTKKTSLIASPRGGSKTYRRKS
ncbi:hypothetical protein Tco_0078545 [Tanacetum coccineum]